MDKNRGFTLIEFIVVISIALLFLGISLPRYNDYSGQLKLRNEAKKLIDVLELAKKKALSSDLIITPGPPRTYCANFTGYRITVSSSSYSLSFGCASVYSVVQDYDLLTNITATIGTGNYDFSPLMINPSFISNTIRLKNSAISKCVTISVSPLGIFELNEALISC